MKLSPESIYCIKYQPNGWIYVFNYTRDQNGNVTTKKRFSKEIIRINAEDLVAIEEVLDENR